MAVLFVSTDYNRYFQLAKNIEIYTNSYRLLNDEHTEGVDPSLLMRTGIDAMVGSLDPYTNFISEAEIEKYRFIENPTKVGNIGAELMMRDDQVVIQEIFKDFAAHKAGLLAGDQLLEIDGNDIKGLSLETVKEHARGAIGSKLTLKIKRESEPSPRYVTLSLVAVEPQNVPYYGMLSDGKTAYIILTVFTQNAAANVADALKKLKEKNDVKGVVLDLRENGGGLLNEAVDIVNLFVPKGLEVVSTKGKVPEWDKSFYTLNPPLDKDIPLVVIINGKSASASEIVSGSIQDLDRGVLLGQRSFGKGLVQNIKEVGFNCKVKITTGKYYIPSGRCIQAVSYKHGKPVEIPDSLRVAFKTSAGRTVYDGGGIVPDYKMPKEEPTALFKAFEEQHLIFDFVTDYRRRVDSIAPASEFALTEKDFQDFVAFLQKRNFRYDSESGKALKELEAAAAKEQYKPALEKHFPALAAAFEKEKQNDLKKQHDDILHELEIEIVSRYYYESGRAEIRLRHDKEIKAALELLANKERYNKLLSGH